MTSKPLLLLALLAAPLALPAASWAQDSYPVYGSSGGATQFETRLSTIEEQFRAVTGRMEQLDYAVRRLDSTVTRMQTDNEARLQRLEEAASRPPAPVVQQPSPAAQAAAAEAVAEPPSGQLGGLKMQNGQVTGAVHDPKASPLPSKPEDYGLTSDEAYDRALNLLRQANYEEAEKAFKSFLDKYPKDKQVQNARYWYGETFYVRARFNDAALAFADAYQMDPKGSKAPDALLKLGMALSALNKTDDACMTYSVLKKDYPKAPISLRSRVDQERIRLKCK